MNYIYDITLNFNKELYEFYDWNKDDNIEFYLKIPIFKVEDSVINDFINCDINVSKEFLNKINNKTENYFQTTIKTCKYASIFTSNDKVVAIVFDKNGNSINKSNMSIDEENEVLEYSKILKYTLIDYKINNRKKNKLNFFTRKEIEVRERSLKLINEIYENKEYDKLRYIFYEIYNEKLNNEKKIYSKLLNLVHNNSDKVKILFGIIEKIKIESKIN